MDYGLNDNLMTISFDISNDLKLYLKLGRDVCSVIIVAIFKCLSRWDLLVCKEEEVCWEVFFIANYLRLTSVWLVGLLRTMCCRKVCSTMCFNSDTLSAFLTWASWAETDLTLFCRMGATDWKCLSRRSTKRSSLWSQCRYVPYSILFLLFFSLLTIGGQSTNTILFTCNFLYTLTTKRIHKWKKTICR